MVWSLTFTEHLTRKSTKHNVAKANRDLIISLKNLQNYCISRRNVQTRCFVQLATRPYVLALLMGVWHEIFDFRIFSHKSVSPGPKSFRIFRIFSKNLRRYSQCLSPVSTTISSLSRIFSDKHIFANIWDTDGPEGNKFMKKNSDSHSSPNLLALEGGPHCMLIEGTYECTPIKIHRCPLCLFWDMELDITYVLVARIRYFRPLGKFQFPFYPYKQEKRDLVSSVMRNTVYM